MADSNANRNNPPSHTGNNRQNYFSSYNSPRYRGPDTDSKGMGNDFTGGNFGSNTRSDGYWERTAQEAGSADAARGIGNPWQSGPNRGKGPRGYQRSGERIREDVCERLTDDGSIDASDIDVKVEQNEVILSGTVHRRSEKRRAEDIAERVSGVRNVQNRIHIDDNSHSRNDDLGHIM